MQDLVPWPGMNLGALHWERRVWTAGPPGKSRETLGLVPVVPLVNRVTFSKSLVSCGPQLPRQEKEKDQLGGLFGPFQLLPTMILRKGEKEKKSRRAWGALGLESSQNQLVWRLYFYVLQYFLRTSRLHCLGGIPWESLLPRDCRPQGLSPRVILGLTRQGPFQMTSLTLLPTSRSLVHCSSLTGLLAILEHSELIFTSNLLHLLFPLLGQLYSPTATYLAPSSYSAFSDHPT